MRHLSIVRFARDHHHPTAHRLDHRRIIGTLGTGTMGRPKNLSPERLRCLNGNQPLTRRGRSDHAVITDDLDGVSDGKPRNRSVRTIADCLDHSGEQRSTRKGSGGVVHHHDIGILRHRCQAAPDRRAPRRSARHDDGSAGEDDRLSFHVVERYDHDNPNSSPGRNRN